MEMTEILPSVRPLRQVEALTQWPRIRVTWQLGSLASLGSTEAWLDLAL